MKPILTPQTLAAVRALTPKQRAALRILHPTQPTLQASSGIPGATWKALRAKGLARHTSSEREWLLTAAGVDVQRAVEAEGR